MNDISQGIESRTREGGKTYSFDETHQKGQPAQYWFQYPPEGLTLFVVLYTQACRWSKCTGCNLPSQMSKYHVPFQDIMRQIDHLFDTILTQDQKQTLSKLILSNNGSVLDEDTFSTTALLYLVAKMNMLCPNIKVLTMETRPEYVDPAELEVLSRALKEGDSPTALELAVGFEAYDPIIRNDHFLKGLTFEMFEKMARYVSKYGFRLKTYFMLKPVPGMTEDEAVGDIMSAIDYLDKISRKFNIQINLHLNPTYVATGTPLAEAFLKGKYQPPKLDSARRAALHAEGKKISIYLGLYDEDLAVPGGSFIRPGDEPLIQKLEKFNQTQDFSYLR